MKISKRDDRFDLTFKSLMKFGRPVIEKLDYKKKRKKDITSDIYIDLEGDPQIILNSVLDSSFGILEGYKGTGKSTIFLVAIDKLERRDDIVTAYSNLQSCFENEEVIENVDSELFIRSVLNDIKNSLVENKKLVKIKEKIEKIFKAALNETILLKESQESYIETEDISNSRKKEKKVGGTLSTKRIGIDTGILKIDQSQSSKKIQTSGTGTRKSTFKITKTMKNLQILLKQEKIESLYLFLDDFSELIDDYQRIAINHFIGPLVKSYNEFVSIKIAVYPNHYDVGDLDRTKMVKIILDPLRRWEYLKINDLEKKMTLYTKNILITRLNKFFDEDVDITSIFDINISGKKNLDFYFDLLTKASGFNLRNLGYILHFCYIQYLSRNKEITVNSIESAAQTYYNEHLEPEFENPRLLEGIIDLEDHFKDLNFQIFFKKKLIELAKKKKDELRETFKNGSLDNKTLVKAIENNRSKNVYYIPTSHFWVDESTSKYLIYLEMNFIVIKYARLVDKSGKIGHVFCLNYGLCQNFNIDYGKLDMDKYWQQRQFNYTEDIYEIFKSSHIRKCSKCKFIYTEQQYQMLLKDKEEYNQDAIYCKKCHEPNTILVKKSIPDETIKFHQLLENYDLRGIDIITLIKLKVLNNFYNKNVNYIKAQEIASLMDTDVKKITPGLGKMERKDYINAKRVKGKVNKYLITKKGIKILQDYFSIKINS